MKMKEEFEDYIKSVYSNPEVLEGTETRRQLESAFFAGAIRATQKVRQAMVKHPVGKAARIIMELSKEVRDEGIRCNSERGLAE